MSVDTPAASTSTSRNGGPTRRFDTLVVGAGFAGIGAAIKLEEAGFDDFAVLEKSDNVGGTLSISIFTRCRLGRNRRLVLPVTLRPTPPRYLALPRRA